MFITKIEDVFAVAAKDLVSTAKFVEAKVVPALQKANADASTIEAITSLVSPQAASIEAAAFTLLGKVVAAIQAAGTASSAGGLSVSLDADTVAAVKALAPALSTVVAVAKKA